jgi:uncharacterized protein (TIGR00106 family)
MHVIADICVVPFTGRPSVRTEVARAHAILKETGLPVMLHAYGTNIEGDYRVIMEALERIHEELHAAGAPRISTTIRLGSRTDKRQGLTDKVRAVEERLKGDSSERP